MAAPRPHYPSKPRSQLQYILLRDCGAHVSPSATIEDLLNGQPNSNEVSLQGGINNSAVGFTDKHQTAMCNLRQEMGNSEDLNFDDALHILESPTRPQTTAKDILEKHAKKCNLIESQEFIGNNASISSSMSTSLTYDYMSGVWQMLQTERESEEFMLSPKGYEFDSAKTKWIPKSHAVVTQIAESKQKCEEWLTKKCEPEIEEKIAETRYTSKITKLPKLIRTSKKPT